MAQELLDGPQIGASLHEMGGERVPEPMRVRGDPPQRARVETRSTDGDEERVLRPARERRPRLP